MKEGRLQEKEAMMVIDCDVSVHVLGDDAVPVGQAKEGMEKHQMWWKVASLKMSDAIGDVYLDDVQTLTLWLAVVI